ncbi:MAG: efflux RND transporter permease subunit, partial [Alistipes sp.]|nr:efflux RND transporter permease subunit [Alistipes sp.]
STNCGVIFASLKDYSERSLSAMEIADALTGELYEKVLGGECFAFIPPAIPGLGVKEGITLEIQDVEGRGTAYLAEQSYRLMDSLKSLPEIASITTQFNADVPQRKLKIDQLKALEYGVSLEELYSEISALLGGDYINNFSKFGKLYQVYLQAAPTYRADSRSLDGYFIQNGDGESIPITTFVEIVDTVDVEYVSQYNLYRSIELSITPAAKSSTGEAMQAIEQTAERILPNDISTAWSGVSFQESRASQSGFMVYVVALLFVFLALASLYNSWGLPIAILLSVPIAVLGALLSVGALHLAEAKYVNDIYLQISLVMLIGLAAKNAILVVEYADRNFFERGMSLAEAAIAAARMRVRPILMTAFAFVLGVMPLVFADGVYATARNIMGVALVGGMTLATIVGIFLYPALYYAVARIGGFERKRELKRQIDETESK